MSSIAHVFVRLGGNARCFYLAGGATGAALDELLTQDTSCDWTGSTLCSNLAAYHNDVAHLISAEWPFCPSFLLPCSLSCSYGIAADQDGENVTSSWRHRLP